MMTFHSDFKMEYLQAPVGDDEFVHAWLDEKIKTLKKIVSLLSTMPHKHEAATLLRSTAAVCRVVYLMRILPPAKYPHLFYSLTLLFALALKRFCEYP